MCGIICYYGSDNAVDYLTKGIKSLEYRGYDSFGCALENGDKINIYKNVGRIKDVLEDYSIDNKTSNKAIFHTRWATHGGIEKANSHPQIDCKGEIAVVHNGIIENWAHLKKGLPNHKFLSNTDTEIIPHMLEEYMKSDNNLMNAVQYTVKKLVGMSSFVVLHKDSPYLVAYKNGSPLVMGIANNGLFVSSDVPSLLNFTKKFVFLHNGDIVKFTKSDYNIENIFGKSYSREIETVNLDPINLGKGEYKHYMEKEIFEQPIFWKKFETIERKTFLNATEIICSSDNVFVIGSGSSYYAALIGSKMLLECGIQSFAVNGEEILDYANIIDDKSAFIVISQSGETADLLSILSFFPSIKKIGIVNVPTSSIARQMDVLLKMRAGVEKAVPSTKSFTSSLLIMNILSSLVEGNENAKELELKNANKEIYNFMVPSVLNAIDSVSEIMRNKECFILVGRGKNYLYALEGALKLKECTYIQAEALDLSGLKHGPLALINSNTWLLAILTNDVMQESLMNLQELKSRGAKIIGISPEYHELFDKFIRVPDMKSYSFLPILMVLQLIAYKVAVKKDINPDIPRNLAKSVTVR